MKNFQRNFLRGLPFILVLANIINCFEEEQTQNGCRIENGACTCSFGYKSEFRYATKRECMDSLKGVSNDACGRNPCLNGGTCIQISTMPGFKCHCEGTGFWGSVCNLSCRDQNNQFAVACVVI